MPKKPRKDKLRISGVEANAILLAFDKEYDTERGKVRRVKHSGLSIQAVQALRDKLFANHEHPEDAEFY